MKFMNIALAIAVALGITVGGSRTAFGDLVAGETLQGAVVNTDAPATSESVANIEATVAAQAASPTLQRAEERKELSRSEVLRRQRLREELKNEDMLTQKLEELRLRDEMKRTDQLLGSGVIKEQDAIKPVSAPLVEERVGSASLDVALTPQPMAPVATVAQPAQTPAVVVSAPMVVEDDEVDNSRVTIAPRGGTSSIVNSIYDVSARYAAGGAITVDVTDHIAFSGGYTYSNYLLGAGSALSYPMTYSYGMQQIELKDHVIDAGMRAYVLGLRSKVRPFIGAGAAFRKGFVNYDDRLLSYLRQSNPYMGRDVDVSGFAGFLETGLDFKLTKNISITGAFRYFNILSARQSATISPYAFVDPSGYGYLGGMNPYYAAYAPAYTGSFGYDPRVSAGDALSRNNFYQLVAGVSVTF